MVICCCLFCMCCCEGLCLVSIVVLVFCRFGVVWVMFIVVWKLGMVLMMKVLLFCMVMFCSFFGELMLVVLVWVVMCVFILLQIMFGMWSWIVLCSGVFGCVLLFSCGFFGVVLVWLWFLVSLFSVVGFVMLLVESLCCFWQVISVFLVLVLNLLFLFSGLLWLLCMFRWLSFFCSVVIFLFFVFWCSMLLWLVLCEWLFLLVFFSLLWFQKFCGLSSLLCGFFNW